MNNRFRKMKDYHPRRSSKEIRANKEKLSTFENHLKCEVEELLAFLRQGSEEKVKECSQKSQTTLSQMHSDMQGIAQEIGPPFPKMVHAFLSSIDKILQAEAHSAHSPFYLWIDEGKIKDFHIASGKLENKLIKQEKRHEKTSAIHS
jgi:hypothetical protein